MKRIKTISLLSVVLAALLLQSCGALIVGAGVGAASAAHDRRTLGTQIDDQTITSRIYTGMSRNDLLKDHASISVQVFNGTALLVGQAPTQELIAQAGGLAESTEAVKKVHNQIRLGAPVPPSVSARDLWLASKVRAKLIADKSINGLHVTIEVENAEVFLMGLVSEQEANIAVEITRNIDGVKQVIKAFEYL